MVTASVRFRIIVEVMDWFMVRFIRYGQR